MSFILDPLYKPVLGEDGKYIFNEANENQILVQNKDDGELYYLNVHQEAPTHDNVEAPPEIEAEVNPNADVGSGDSEEDDGNSRVWTDQRIIFLLDQIQATPGLFEGGFKKTIWTKIAKACVSKFGTEITAKACESKWKSLKRTYKSILLHNSTSGNKRKRWQYFSKIDSFMQERPEIYPIATCSTLSGLQLNSKASKSKDDTSGNTIVTTSTSLQDESSISSFSKKRKSKESAVELRHKEKMNRMDTFNNLFSTLIDKIGK